MIFSDKYERVLDAARSITARRERVAKFMLAEWLETTVGPNLSSDALLAHIIAESLLSRIDRRLVDAKHIYLEKFDISQIEMFYTMTQGYPQVPLAHRAANGYLAHELSQHEDAAMVEIGIGRGAQVASMLSQLGAMPHSKLARLTLHAVDPDPQNLIDARKQIDGIRKGLPFKIRFHAVEGLVEKFDRSDLAQLKTPRGVPLVMNSAYTLHHILHEPGDRDLRTRILKALREELQPRLFTLIEPNANHDTESLTARLEACWAHFGTVFDLIDQADIPEDRKFVIKEKFFGREIRDIFGTSDAYRCERHEPYEGWMLRLRKAGFHPYDDTVVTPTAGLPSRCDVQQSDGLVRLGYRGEPLIAVFAYRADAAA